MKSSSKDLKKAHDLYTRFREATPRVGRRIAFIPPKALAVLGTIVEIRYDTTRGQKTEKYQHKFHEGSRPLMCADGKGRLFIVEGRYHVTERGIVDLDSKGRELE